MTTKKDYDIEQLTDYDRHEGGYVICHYCSMPKDVNLCKRISDDTWRCMHCESKISKGELDKGIIIRIKNPGSIVIDTTPPKEE